MKNLNSKSRREIVWMAAISILALSPLLFVSLNSRFRTPAPPPLARRPNTAPVVARQSESLGPVALSPNGRWEALMEPSLPTSTAVRGNSGDKDVVIRSARGGGEIFRASNVGEFRKWVRGTSAFIAQDHFGLTIFSPSAAAIGTGAAPWTGVPLAFAPGTDMDEEDKKEYALNGESAFGTRRPMNFSPDGRFAVRSSWNQGEIEWTVADLSTRKFAKPVKIGRWLNYDPHVGGAANGILACVGPARGAKTSYPLVAVIQELPLARPKTAPTPAYSVAQRQYIEKEQRLEREKGDAMSKSDSQSQKRFFACCVRKR